MISNKTRLASLAGTTAISLVAAWTSASAEPQTAQAPQSVAPAVPAPIAYPYSNAYGVIQMAAADQPAAAGMSDSQRLDNLERTVQQLNDIVNGQSEELAKPKGPKVTTTGGLKVESEDGQFSFQPIGRLHLDGAWYDQDKSHRATICRSAARVSA